MEIVLTGSVAFDYLMYFPGNFRDHILTDKLQSISLSFLVDRMVKRRGGVAPNIAYNMALLGGKPRVMATVGEDFKEYRQWLEDYGIDTSLMTVVPGEFTASFFANTDQENNQIASFYTGAMAHAKELSFHNLKKKPDLVVISPNDPEAMKKYVRECIELSIPYIYDPSQQIVRLSGEDLQEGIQGALALMINEYEFALIQKRTGLSDEQIRQSLAFMIVTLGEKGSLIYTDNQQYNIPIVPPKKIADPTGVGDAYRAGFITGYLHSFDWQTCGQMGALSASYCLETDGSQSQHYTIKQYIERFRKHFNDHGQLDVLLNRKQ